MNKKRIWGDARFKFKSDPLSKWEANNPVLLAGEFGVVTGIKEAGDGLENKAEKVKIGDGIHDWNTLGWWYASEGVGNSINVDQTYNPESENAQSGKAVAEALDTLPLEHDNSPDLQFKSNLVQLGQGEAQKNKLAGKVYGAAVTGQKNIAGADNTLTGGWGHRNFDQNGLTAGRNNNMQSGGGSGAIGRDHDIHTKNAMSLGSNNVSILDPNDEETFGVVMLGRGLLTNKENQTAMGVCNAPSDDALFMLGNGGTFRQNALTVKKDGSFTKGGHFKPHLYSIDKNKVYNFKTADGKYSQTLYKICDIPCRADLIDEWRTAQFYDTDGNLINNTFIGSIGYEGNTSAADLIKLTDNYSDGFNKECFAIEDISNRESDFIDVCFLTIITGDMNKTDDGVYEPLETGVYVSERITQLHTQVWEDTPYNTEFVKIAETTLPEPLLQSYDNSQISVSIPEKYANYKDFYIEGTFNLDDTVEGASSHSIIPAIRVMFEGDADVTGVMYGDNNLYDMSKQHSLSGELYWLDGSTLMNYNGSKTLFEKNKQSSQSAVVTNTGSVLSEKHIKFIRIRFNHWKSPSAAQLNCLKPGTKVVVYGKPSK